MKTRNCILILTVMMVISSCKKYLDIIPDNIATLENAFALRNEAEKYLFTCYSYLPSHGIITGNPAFTAGDELSLIYPVPPGANFTSNGYEIARGNQNIINPHMNFWDGANQGKDFFGALRDCNIFLDNIERVPDMTPDEKTRWRAEVKVLKAYYHFYLVRMYGPIPIIKTNLPVDAGVDAAKVYRDPVDSCFTYITQLLDEAKDSLPLILDNPTDELGRITQPVAYMLKAKVLVTAASPLFNGNPDYASFKDARGTALFNAVVDNAKWEKAANACKEAIDICTASGAQLYYFVPDITQGSLSAQTKTQMNIRNSINLKWNPEIVWGFTNSMTSDLQRYSIPRGLDPALLSNTSPAGQLAPPLKMAELFYSKNGVPITEDKTWDYNSRYNLRTGTANEKYFISQGYTTAQLNFDREPRYYADLGFDGGVWYGQGKYDDNSPLVVMAKLGQAASAVTITAFSTTGYWTKKYVHYQDVIGSGSTLTITNYPWPEMRLADLYLLYAEALNEAKGPVDEALTYINMVRQRAGIPTVQDAWTQFSTSPSAYTTKEGLRTIIHRERSIELAFEGSRLWDLKRWKEAAVALNQPILGWTTDQQSAQGYYQPRLIFVQRFSNKDYLWPIRDNNIVINRNLVQNPGW
ncbi:RagB/SusD family nutrient uptake outer membrane protein [Niabella pedocola]|uniref:RagB/SusD family nutrient uptake outer membrane protein n=1 Tax=Niabella pedocola TaxID=1752077 RepID=A0ABS8PWH7_9BACT|nr:RagB/SusD family nutrient uptake outer membrane protein [Niabella pedocola]MCD2424673.1 RagB/SusD family nutrient uptake outer membrane protein [Niabella pedocola]